MPSSTATAQHSNVEISPPLSAFALAALAAGLGELPAAPEIDYLRSHLDVCGHDEHEWRERFEASMRARGGTESDERLLRLRETFELAPIELLVVALALAVEQEPMAGRALAYLQKPVGGSRPTLWLLDQAFSFLGEQGRTALDHILGGAALGSGLLTMFGPELPLVERTVAVPGHVLLALRGLPANRAGYDFDTHRDELPLSATVLRTAQRYAYGLTQGVERSLVVRAASLREARAVAAAIAAAMAKNPVFITNDDVSALAPWIYASDLLPVFQRDMGPSERFKVPRIAHYSGPYLVICGLDGGIEVSRRSPLTFRVDVPQATERQALWQRALGSSELAIRLAQTHRHGMSRIADLGRLARQRAQMDERPVTFEDIVEVSCTSDPSGLNALAEPVAHRVPSDALVVSPQVRRELDLLLLRCRKREALANGLGVSTTTRYRPGVRALFSGPSGTGKTLACAWIATELGLPMYRVDVASVVSKYIGETEKNLAELLARAEHAEVVLLFDEADSLFGRRTEVKQANDRFANTQTNYLLQRIENYDGIVVLTTNSRGRLDSAFTRRLDFVIEFPSPKPDERREIWLSHLGTNHCLKPRQVNQLAALVDLSGGHIRNVVLCAAVLAQHESRLIDWEDLLRGVAVEYRKLGKQIPSGLNPGAEGKITE